MTEATSHHLLDQDKVIVVERDRLPRVARYRTEYDDGTSGETQHVLYWGGVFVQSMIFDAWLAQRGPLPIDPTPAESDAAVAAIAQAAQQAQADAAQLRQQVLATLQTAVGVRFIDLNNAQLRAIVEALAWQAGALKPDTTVRPPSDWIR